MSTLQIQLLGDFRLAVGEVPITTLSQLRQQALLAKVQAVIQHRLAQLSAAAREVAAVAAVIGRSFALPVVAQATALTEDALVAGLDELWQRRIVREQDVNSYDFSHDRIREVTYAAISPARRRLLHRQVAQALEGLAGDQLAPVAGQLAIHYEQAGLPQQAFTYYRLAATTAHQLFAYLETETFLRKTYTCWICCLPPPSRSKKN